MALAVPTAAEFKARYPAFANVGDALVALVITEATAFVHEGWIAAHQKPAIMCATAHLLAAEGYGGPAAATGSSYGALAGPIREVQVGDVKTSFSDRAAGQSSQASTDAGGFAATQYGRQFLKYVRINAPGVMVV